MYLVEEVEVVASPIMSHHNFFLVLLQSYFLESAFHSLHNNRKVLPPLNFLLRFGGVGEIDEEHPAIFKRILIVNGFPNLTIIRPSLQKHNNVLTVLIPLQKILQRLSFRHPLCYDIFDKYQ